ncbi:hypothetical protein [Streptomyces sp. NBC_01565]|uniref:hypothetical protein n=1 Tax=unclassified Streptomyces TaxID=2593676 RepID=UPI00225468A9|nr:hypothetical protein [Streptomyces sp. NBC_01565]MCX4545957.1 hypothetical protein [Streptomyces sp. NBC_01565]
MALDVHEAAAGAELVELTLAALGSRRQQVSLPLPLQNPAQLPLHELQPEVFERLVAEMVSRHDNRGVQFYGRSGQKQYGLDVVEREPGGLRSLYQVKRYASLTRPLIRSAVVDYAGSPRPSGHSEPPRLFNPHRFVVVTSASLDSDTAWVEEVTDLQDEYTGDLEIEFWGAEAVSRKLRDAPNLVASVFGPTWSEAWCGVTHPPMDPAAPPSLGLVSGPIAVLNLESIETDAKEAEGSDPAQSERLYGLLAQALLDGNFPGHAAQFRGRQAEMARRAGDAAKAFDILFCLELDRVSSGGTDGNVRALEAVASEAGQLATAKWSVLSAVANWYEQGSQLLVTVPALRVIAAAGDSHTGLLCCLVLEHAVVDGLYDADPHRSLVVEQENAPSSHLVALRELCREADSRDPVIRARLKVALADSTLRLTSSPQEVEASYGLLLSEAGAGRYRHARGLITSRAAHAFAMHGDAARADALWNQSVLATSEDGLFGDARLALRSLRLLAIDRGSFVFGLEAITRALPNRRRLLAGAFDPSLSAYAAAHRGKLPDAFADTRRHLWESRIQGALQEEILAMELFGDVLAAGNYAAEAIQAYAHAGSAKKAAELARTMSSIVDVTTWLGSPVRRRVATAVQVIGAQEALFTDADAAEIITLLLQAAEGLWRAPAAFPNPAADALKALAHFTNRLSSEDITSFLTLVARALREPTRYNGEIAELLINALRFSPCEEITTAIADMLQLPNQEDLWNLLGQLRDGDNNALLPTVEALAAEGITEAVNLLNSWLPETGQAQLQARETCAALLRRPVGVPKQQTSVGTIQSTTVSRLLGLLSCANLVPVAAEMLTSDRSAFVEAFLVVHTTVTSLDEVSATEITGEENSATPDSCHSGGTDPDSAAVIAAGPPSDLATAVAKHLTAMAEDPHDWAASRNISILALSRLLHTLTPQVSEEIARRLLSVHSAPRLSKSDEWEISSNAPLSRTRLNSGSAQLSDNALRVAAQAWANSREPSAPLSPSDKAFTARAISSAAALLRSDDPGNRARGARCVAALADGSLHFKLQAGGLALHGCQHVRAIGVAHLSSSDPLLIALSEDPAPRVRAAVAQRADELPQQVLDSLAQDTHLGVRRTLSMARRQTDK